MKHDIGGLSLDLDNLLFKLKFNDPGADVSLVDLCIEKIKEYKNPLVCLSGGYDSQFMCLLLKQAGIEFTAVLISSLIIWEPIASPCYFKEIDLIDFNFSFPPIAEIYFLRLE